MPNTRVRVPDSAKAGDIIEIRANDHASDGERISRRTHRAPRSPCTSSRISCAAMMVLRLSA